MVLFLEESPSFGSQFGKALGQGLGKGLDSGFAQKIKEMQLQQKQKEKNLQRVGRDTSGFLNRRDPYKNYRDPDFVRQLEGSARKYIEKGYDTEEALDLAMQEGIEQQQVMQSQRPPPSKSKFEEAFSPGYGEKIKNKVVSDIKGGLLKAARPWAGLIDIASNKLNKGPEALKNIREGNPQTNTELFDRLTGGKGIPQNSVEQVFSAYPFGPEAVVGALAGETASQAGLPESVQDAAEILTFLAAHRASPRINSLISDAKRSAKSSGLSTEEVLQKAHKESGVNLEDLAAGDEGAFAKFKNSITAPPEVAQKVKEVPKERFNKKAALKERKAFGEKLPESPFQEYFDIDAREAHKIDRRLPETQWQFEQIRLKNEPLIEKEWHQIQRHAEGLKGTRKELMKAVGEDKARLDTLKKFYEHKIERSRELIKDLEYEKKYARPRPTEEQIQAKIDEALTRFEEQAKNPTPEGQEKIQKDIKADQKYIERAEKLVARGELPGEIRPDTHIKMKKAYADRYKAAIQEQKQILREMKGAKDAESIKAKAQVNKFIETLENRVKRLESDIVNQTDKIKAMNAIRPPSGAFYREQLKSLKKDIIDFQHDFFKAKTKPETAGEIKTQKAVKDKFPKFEREVKAGEEFAKNPTIEEAERIAKENGKKPSQGKEAVESVKEMKEELSKNKDAIEKGKNPSKVIGKLSKGANKLVAYIGVGTAVGIVQALSEEYFGVKPNQTTVKLLFGLTRAGSLGVAPSIHKLIRDQFEGRHVKKLQELRYRPQEFQQYVRNLQADYGEAKTKRIIKKTQESYKKAA